MGLTLYVVLLVTLVYYSQLFYKSVT